MAGIAPIKVLDLLELWSAHLLSCLSGIGLQHRAPSVIPESDKCRLARAPGAGRLAPSAEPMQADEPTNRESR
jgi:hypothetical protein